MLIQLIIAVIVGILAGTITGLIPGIHINLIAILLTSISPILLSLTTPLTLVIFITAMAITHTFIDFIPSIFLGAPDEDSVLSVLPGHRLLLKGKAYHAIVLTLKGSFTGLIIILLLTPLFIFTLPKYYLYAQRIMPIILILASGYLIFFTEKEKTKKLWALIIFLLAGFLGIASLNLNLKEPLLPLLTGLFGASNLIISIKNKTKIPEQKLAKIKNIKLNKKSTLKTSFASLIAAPLTSFLPGLGSAQAAVIGSEVTGDLNSREFLFLLGAINTIVMGLSFITLYSIQKTRTGAAVAVSKLLPELTTNNLLFIITAILISGLIAFILTVLISKQIAKRIHKFNYTKLSYIILISLTILILIFSDMRLFGGIKALLIFLTGASLGISAILLKIKRMHLMGCLLVPTILYYLL